LTLGLISIVLISAVSVLFQLPVAQTSPQLIAYRVSGRTNLGSPGSESFWGQIPWVNVSLSANLQGVPTSGITPYVAVKAAWNGTDFILLARWQSPEPASGAWSAAAAALYPPASGPGLFRVIELTPGTSYRVESNYTGYVSVVNGKSMVGRILFNYSGITLLAPNDTQIYVLQNGTILFYHSPRPMEYLFDQDGMFYGYYVNSTWYYPDRFAVMWYMGAESSPMDCMNIGGKFPGQLYDGVRIKDAGGSLSAGPASIWMWVSGATWNSSGDPAFAADLWQNTSATGLPYVDQGNHGFAVPLFTNQTNIYEVDTAGIWYSPVTSSGLNGSLYYVWTGASWSSGYWTLEIVRPMSVPSGWGKWMPELQPGHEYDVAFAVWQGRGGETLFDKSITSSFLTLYISNQSYTTTTSSTSSVSTSTTYSPLSSVSFTVTIIGLVVALVVLALLYVVFRK